MSRISDSPLYPKLRWLAAIWLLIYVPSYTAAYGVTNFLFLCNLGVFITALALLVGNQLLISTQAVAAPFIGLVWALDAGTRLLTGDFLFGGTAYMWDPQYPLFTRLLSLYHLFWPLLVLWCSRKNGYDRRGWPAQTAIAGVGLVLSRWLTAPELNVNYAYRDPLFNLELGPGPLHLALIAAVLGGVIYGITHAFLTRVLKLPSPESTRSS